MRICRVGNSKELVKEVYQSHILLQIISLYLYGIEVAVAHAEAIEYFENLRFYVQN
jgi:hypothetical protein